MTKEIIRTITYRYGLDDNMGVPHPIFEDALQNDLQWLIDQAKNASELEDELINREQSHMDIYNEMKEYKRENKRFRDALMIAYSHCFEDEMDETIDAIRMALDGEEVSEIWANDLANGYSILEKQQ